MIEVTIRAPRSACVDFECRLALDWLDRLPETLQLSVETLDLLEIPTGR